VIATPVIAPEEHLTPAAMPRAALAGHHRGRRDEESDAPEDDVYDESHFEDAIHVQPSFSLIEADREPSIVAGIFVSYII
jgi:hypothetical protein